MLVVSCFLLISHEDKYRSQGEINLPISRVRDSILSSPIRQLAAACQGAAATEGVSGGVTCSPVWLCAGSTELSDWAADNSATWLSLPRWYLGPMLYVTTRWLVTHLSFFFPIQGDWCQSGEAGARQRPWVFCFSCGQSCRRTCWEIRSGGPSFWNGLFYALGVLFVCLFFNEDSLLADSKWSKKRNALFCLLFIR